jgi:hypothetical protein
MTLISSLTPRAAVHQRISRIIPLLRVEGAGTTLTLPADQLKPKHLPAVSGLTKRKPPWQESHQGGEFKSEESKIDSKATAV